MNRNAWGRGLVFTGRTISDEVGNTGTEFSSVDFFAPPGVSLDQGESFGVAIRWVEDASAV